VQTGINGTWTNLSTWIFITLEYPSNDSYIVVVQPTVYFNLTNLLRDTMNYSIYIGDNATSCDTLLFSDANVTNGTQFDANHLYYSATNYTAYYWRVQVDDGWLWINEIFNFTLYAEAEIIDTPGFEIVLFLVSLFAIIYWRRKSR